VPVATVSVDGAANAGMLAAQILAVEDPKLAQRIRGYRQHRAESVLKRAEELQSEYSG
jgi:5-(carboxyamino)imidazole ribonucleotide mutase